MAPARLALIAPGHELGQRLTSAAILPTPLAVKPLSVSSYLPVGSFWNVVPPLMTAVVAAVRKARCWPLVKLVVS